jgi:hypothetical protein
LGEYVHKRTQLCRINNVTRGQGNGVRESYRRVLPMVSLTA